MSNLHIQVKGMMCANCEARVIKALLLLEGIESCEASAQTGKVDVSYDEKQLQPATIKEMIEEVGYVVESAVE